jgi:hypothetical protein
MKTESLIESKDKWLGTSFFQVKDGEEEKTKKRIEFLRLAARLAVEELFSEMDVNIKIRTEFKINHAGSKTSVNELYLPAEFYNRRIACMVREQGIKEFYKLVEKTSSNLCREDLYDKTNS